MPNPFGKRSGDTRDTGNEGARKRNEQPLVQQLIGVRQHALNLPKSVLPKVFLVKRRNICVSHSGSPACASTPSICNKSAESAVPFWQTFVHLRVSPAGHPSHLLPAPHPSRACRAFCSPWPWKVWPSGPARSVLRSPGRKAPLAVSSPPRAAARASTSGAPPNFQTSKPPNFQKGRACRPNKKGPGIPGPGEEWRRKILTGRRNRARPRPLRLR